MLKFKLIVPLTLALGMMGGLSVASYAASSYPPCPTNETPQSLSPTDNPTDSWHDSVNDPQNVNDDAACPIGTFRGTLNRSLLHHDLRQPDNHTGAAPQVSTAR